MKNTRNTIQYELVFNAVQELKTHPTAEEIYSFIREKHPHVSKGTVYRNLNLLVEQGSVRRVSHLQNSADRFDFELTPHYHFHCHGCNRVFDVAMPYLDDLCEAIDNRDDFFIESYEITFSGLCARCKKPSN